MTYVLDRFEEEFALFVGDDETLLKLSADNFRGYREGDVFIGPDEAQNPDVTLIFDEAETVRRRKETRERFQKLLRRDH